MVGNDAIAAIMANAYPEAAVDRLIEAALAAGGNDNVSAIVVRNAPGLDGEQTLPSRGSR
jgi:serine/threonine protein phosphatase PrpC